MSEKRKVWNSRTPTQETKHKALMIMLRSGLVTVGEAAKLLQITRQAMHKNMRSEHGPNPLRAREQYLRQTWKDLIGQMTHH